MVGVHQSELFELMEKYNRHMVVVEQFRNVVLSYVHTVLPNVAVPVIPFQSVQPLPSNVPLPPHLEFIPSTSLVPVDPQNQHKGKR